MNHTEYKQNTSHPTGDILFDSASFYSSIKRRASWTLSISVQVKYLIRSDQVSYLLEFYQIQVEVFIKCQYVFYTSAIDGN